MLVTGVEIMQYQYCPKSTRHMANVCLTLKNQMVTLFCQLELPETATGPQRVTAFVREAIRQMRRMPEYRSGEVSLDVPASLMQRLDPDMLAA